MLRTCRARGRSPRRCSDRRPDCRNETSYYLMDTSALARENQGYAETSRKDKDEPMADTIGVIAMGEMGSGVARRLHERGATVITQLAGRSAASAARAERAGAIPVSTDDEFAAQADFILSIVPPCD